MAAVPAPQGDPDAGATWHHGDPLGEQRAAVTGAMAVDRSHRTVLHLGGADRLSWLHSLTTAHVAGLGEGDSVQNLGLDGQGRVLDHWWQTELGGVTVLDTESARGEELLRYLTTMVFWADVTVSRAADGVLSLLGPALAGPTVLAALRVDALPAVGTAIALSGGGLLRSVPADVDGPSIALDVVAPPAALAELAARLHGAGVRPAGTWAYEAHRVAGRRPRLGVDTDDRTIPHEVGWISSAVHLDKGCYRGQETVARVHNLGRPPRMLVLAHLDGAAGDGERPRPGDPVLAGGRTVGRVGTVVEHVDLGPVALLLVKRAVDADVALTAGGATPAELRIDPDSIPRDQHEQAGRAAVERLRRSAR